MSEPTPSPSAPRTQAAPAVEQEMARVFSAGPGALSTRMGIEVTEATPERVAASMPVEGNRQSFGLLHGGAMVAMAEAAGSWAAVIHGSLIGKVAVGLDINATHHRSSRQGRVTATATAIHLGSSTTTHEVLIENEGGVRLCTARITNFLKDAPAG